MSETRFTNREAVVKIDSRRGSRHHRSIFEAYAKSRFRPFTNGDWYDCAHFPQLAAGAAAVKLRAPVSLFASGVAPVVVGKNGAPALAANTVISGPFSDRCRLLTVAGPGTTAGAAVRVTVMTQRSFPRN